MRKMLFPFLAASSMMFAAVAPAHAQPTVDDATVAAVLEKLQSSGALDKAIDSGIRRYTENINAERQRQQSAREQLQQKMAQSIKGPQSNEYVRGAANARFTLIEYSDIECPFCKKYHESMLAAMKAYPSDINWVWRHFPLSFHGQAAVKEAVASECAGKLGGGKAFWAAIDYMMDKTRSNGQGMPGSSPYAEVATAAKVSKVSFDACLASDASAEKVKADFMSGQQLGVNGTPSTYIIDNKTKKVTYFAQALPPEMLIQRIADIKREAGE